MHGGSSIGGLTPRWWVPPTKHCAVSEGVAGPPDLNFVLTSSVSTSAPGRSSGSDTLLFAADRPSAQNSDKTGNLTAAMHVAAGRSSAEEVGASGWALPATNRLAGWYLVTHACIYRCGTQL